MVATLIHFVYRRAICLLLCGAVFVPWTVQAQSGNEYRIKAAFLYNFAQFVDWPADAFANTNSPFCIGVLGQDPFGRALDEIVQGENIDNHRLIVRRARHVEDLRDCQLIFISKSERNQIGEIISALGSRPVLTVSEIDGFARRGGGINFYIEGNKVHFEINPSAAQRSRLKISSQLLSLGKIVQTGKDGK